MYVKHFIGALDFEISQNCTHTKWVGLKQHAHGHCHGHRSLSIILNRV